MKHISAFLLPAAAACLLCLLAGCDGRTFYHSYLPLPAEGWDKHDTLTFLTDTVRQSGEYDFDLELRSTERCPFQSVWLVAERDFGGAALSDTVECRLMDADTRRMGSGIHAYRYTVALPPAPLAEGQTGRIQLRHCMHREVVTGLLDAGIRIVRRP